MCEGALTINSEEELQKETKSNESELPVTDEPRIEETEQTEQKGQEDLPSADLSSDLTGQEGQDQGEEEEVPEPETNGSENEEENGDQSQEQEQDQGQDQDQNQKSNETEDKTTQDQKSSSPIVLICLFIILISIIIIVVKQYGDQIKAKLTSVQAVPTEEPEEQAENVTSTAIGVEEKSPKGKKKSHGNDLNGDAEKGLSE